MSDFIFFWILLGVIATATWQRVWSLKAAPRLPPKRDR
jgi:hypothetical protein